MNKNQIIIEKIEELKSYCDSTNCFIYFYLNFFSSRFQASYCCQFFYLFWRQLKSTIREPFATRILFAQSVVIIFILRYYQNKFDFVLIQLIGLFLGFTYYQLGNDQASIQNKSGLLFIMLMQACLSYLFGVANVRICKIYSFNKKKKLNLY